MYGFDKSIRYFKTEFCWIYCWPDSILETLVTAKDQKNLSGSLTVTKSKGTA